MISSIPFEEIFKEAAIGIVLTNQQSEIILTNAFADRLFGYQSGELLGKNIAVLIPNHLKDRHEGHQQQFLKHPVARPMGAGLDLKAKRKDESLFPVEISLSHMQTSHGKFFIAFVSDITLKRKVEMELILRNKEINQLNENLEQEVKARTKALQETLERLEANKLELEQALIKEKELGDLKTRFVSMASHEFRTPLTSILSASSLLERYPLTEQQEKRQQHIQRIKHSVNHLTEILEEFLSVGRLEAGKVDLHVMGQDLPDFIEDLLMDLKPSQGPEQGIHLDMPQALHWHTDFSILRKILINALSNALKFSQKEVVLRIFEQAQSLHIQVEDRGMGISKEDQKHLFERFFRGSNASAIQGTGLGLYLIDRYTQLLGGKLQLHSELNKGTRLHLEFPQLHSQ